MHKHLAGIHFALLLSLFFCVHATAGTLNGTVLLQDGDPAINAHVTLANSTYATTTNSSGAFVLKNIVPGSYQIKISYIGCETYNKQVYIGEQAVQLKIILKAASTTLAEAQIESKKESTIITEQPIEISSLDVLEFYNRKSTISQAIDQVAGVRIRQTGGLGANAEISLNGMRGRSVRLYIDGIPMDYLAAGLNISQIPLNSVKRIDIYKGVMPVNIGTDALGGGINLVTQTPESNYLRASYSLGSFNTHQVGLVTGFYNKKHKLYFNLSSSYNYSDNNYKMQAYDLNTSKLTQVERFNDAFRSFYTMASFGIKNRAFADKLELSVAFADFYKEYQHGLMVNTTPFGEAFYTATNYYANLSYAKTFGKLNVSSIAGFGRLNYVFNDTSKNIYNWTGDVYSVASHGGESNRHAMPLFPHINDDSYYNRTSVSYPFQFNGTLVLSNFFGATNRSGYNPLIDEENGEIDYLKNPHTLQKNISGIEYSQKLLQQRLTLGGAFKYYYFKVQGIEHNTNQDLIFTKNRSGYTAFAKYNFTENFFARTSFESAMRIPDADEFFGDNALTVPNIALQPEESNNLNLGFSYATSLSKKSSIKASANGFYRAQRNRIFLNANGGFFAVYENREAVDVKGVELTAKTQFLDRFTLTGNLTYQSIVLVQSGYTSSQYQEGRPLPNEPVFFYNLELIYQFKNWLSAHKLSVNAFYNHVNEFAFIPVGAKYNKDNYVPVQDQIDMGISAQFLKERLTASVNVHNLLNADLYDYYMVPKPGTAFYVKLIYELKHF